MRGIRGLNLSERRTRKKMLLGNESNSAKVVGICVITLIVVALIL